jgi:hypothetical protein
LVAGNAHLAALTLRNRRPLIDRPGKRGRPKAYALRISSEILEAMQRGAQDEPSGANTRIEYGPREVLRRGGRTALACLGGNEPPST